MNFFSKFIYPFFHLFLNNKMILLFLLIFILVLIIGLYYFTSKEDEDIDRCYTDFLFENDPEYAVGTKY